MEKQETEAHYVISDLSWSGQWAWENVAARIYEVLKATEPKNLASVHPEMGNFRKPYGGKGYS
jgi:hypothetical protein